MELDERPDSRSLLQSKAAAEHRAGDLRRLKLIGVVLPLLFVLALELIRLGAIEGGFAEYRAHIALALSIVVGVVVFSFLMFHLIERAQAETAEVLSDLRRRQREGHGFYDVLLRISNQEALVDVLAAVARHARDLLSGDDAAVCLDDATARSVQLGPAASAAPPPLNGVCISADGEDSHCVHDLHEIDSLRSSPEIAESLRVSIHSRAAVFGELWIGRRSTVAFSERDRQFLVTLSDLASIAVTGARLREKERQAATLAERERIARELHDSLAQVLGATHLRLRALGSREDVRAAPAIASQLSELADICEEGYRDARGAILDLHESSRADNGLLDSLRRYLDKYSQQCGVATSLETTLDHDLALPPHSEIQIIRVIQEALTNVRKHSGAAAATVRITQANGTAMFVVEDNGCGFDSDSVEMLLDRDGFGLHAMRERMELIGGTLSTDSASGRGTRVVAEVPVPSRADQERVELDASLT